MDVISYFLSEGGHGNALSSALRLAVLAFTAAVGFAAAPSKRPFYLTFCTLAAFTVLHFVFLLPYGTPSAADAVNLIRIYSLPVTAVSFYALLDSDEGAVRALFRAVTVSFAVIVCVMTAAALTNTDPHTYHDKEIGVLGWFYGTNAQSAVLSMAVPFAVAFASTCKRKSIAVAAASVIGAAALFAFATRLAYAAIFGISLSFFVAAILMRRHGKDTPSPVIFLIAPVLAAALFPISPMMSNRQLIAENAAAKDAETEEILSSGTAENLYSRYLGTMTERFGFDTVYDAYGGSLETSVLTDVRLSKITYSSLLMKERPLCRLFGLDYTSMTSGGENFDAENDFHGIYFLCGAVGSALLFAMLASYAFPFFVTYFKRRTSIDFFGTAAFASAACGIVHAYFTAGVLRRPNASFYLAVTLAVMLHASKTSLRRDSNSD